MVTTISSSILPLMPSSLTTAFKFRWRIFLKPKGLRDFIGQLPKGARLLDVGCGNNSPFNCKTQRPDLFYVGLDIGDYNQKQTPASYADQYITIKPEEFAPAIAAMHGSFEGIISSHNIEHCLDPEATLRSMLQALKNRGQLYMAFPCAASRQFPHRKGTLNFYDDSTHRWCPELQKILAIIETENCRVDYLAPRYRPILLFMLGFLLEPFSFLLRKVMVAGSTWAFYGFETIVWISRP